MTPAQIRKAKSLVGKISRDDICRQLGVSTSNLKRSCPGISFYFFNRYAAQPELVEKVCKYYERHGKKKTTEKFPDICIRSVVERYKNYAPRQTRWTPRQIRQAAQMAGLVSIEDQAKFFNRPGANRGSIVSLWMKKFKLGGGNVNGLSWNIARNFVRPQCPKIKTSFWRRREWTKESNRARFVVTWKDFEKYQKHDNPAWVKEAASALARFQIWLHGTKQIRARVQKIVDSGGI